MKPKKTISPQSAHKTGVLICKKLGITAYKLCKYSGIGNTTWYRWKRWKRGEDGTADTAFEKMVAWAREQRVKL